MSLFLIETYKLVLGATWAMGTEDSQSLCATVCYSGRLLNLMMDTVAKRSQMFNSDYHKHEAEKTTVYCD